MFTCIFRLNHPSHSCEGRNFIAEGGNCRRRRLLISRRFAAAEIPAFAGMGRWGRGRNRSIGGNLRKNERAGGKNGSGNGGRRQE
ncbi:MAG: hypothetical protein ACR2QC_11505 [Gammaproteobacteria bacterium]